MAISEQQLETWSHIGSLTQSASTYRAVKEALEQPGTPFEDKTFEIYLQGSYGNNTNVRGAESDVDIVICLTDVYRADTSSLSPTGLQTYQANFSAAQYGFRDFKSDVVARPRSAFGSGVELGGKAIFIPGDGHRRDADLIACIEHRRYSSGVPPVSWTVMGFEIPALQWRSFRS